MKLSLSGLPNGLCCMTKILFLERLSMILQRIIIWLTLLITISRNLEIFSRYLAWKTQPKNQLCSRSRFIYFLSNFCPLVPVFGINYSCFTNFVCKRFYYLGAKKSEVSQKNARENWFQNLQLIPSV